MKAWLELVVIVLLIIVSGLAGYFLHKTKTETKPDTVVVIRPDRETLLKIDSLEFVIKTLKTQLAKTKTQHEETINSVDTLSAPELYRKIAEYYSRK